MKIGEALKQIFNPAMWTDRAFVNKSMPPTNYIGANGIHNYSPTDPGFSIVELGRREMQSSLIYGGHAKHNFIELFHCIPEIFAPIHAYASRIANADFQLRKTFNDQVQYKDAAWNRLFNTPNPLQHFRQLIYEAVVYELATGDEMMYFNTPSTLEKNYQNVSTIWNLPSDQIKIIPRKPFKLYSATELTDIVETYKLDDNNRFDPADILHIRGINLKWDDGKINGKPPLQSADKAVANLIAVYEARNVIYTKRGALGMLVSKVGDESGLQPLTPKQKRDLQDDVQGNYGITGGRSPIAVTNLPVEYVSWAMSIRELEPFKETLADAAAIYGALGVPFELAPKMEGETFSNQENAEKSFYQNSIIPKANMYMQSLTNKLGLNEAKLYLHASFDHVPVLQEDKKDKAQVDKTNGETYLQRFLHGVSPLNEWVVSTGNEKVSNPLYDLRLFEMTPEQLEQVKAVLQMKAPQLNQTQDGAANTTANTGNTGADQAGEN